MCVSWSFPHLNMPTTHILAPQSSPRTNPNKYPIKILGTCMFSQPLKQTWGYLEQCWFSDSGISFQTQRGKSALYTGWVPRPSEVLNGDGALLPSWIYQTLSFKFKWNVTIMFQKRCSEIVHHIQASTHIFSGFSFHLQVLETAITTFHF